MSRHLFLLVALITLVLQSDAISEDYPWPDYKMADYKSFDAYVAAMVPHIKTAHDPSRSVEAVDHFGTGAYSQLERFCKHPHVRVRGTAYRHLLTFLHKTEPSARRREQFLRFLSGLDDSQQSICQFVARRMNTFGVDVHSKKSKAVITRLLKRGERNTHTFRHIILAAGVARMESAIPTLRRHRGEHATFALARLGDEKALTKVIAQFPINPEIKDFGLLFNKLKLLAYTKQPKALDLIHSYLHQETLLVKGANDYGPVSLAGLASEIFADLFPELAIKDHLARRQESIDKCRAWLKETNNAQNWTKVPGEISRW